MMATVELNPLPEVGKVTFKIKCNEALSDESVLKSNGDEVVNDFFS